MEWLVLNSIFITATGYYALILQSQSETIKMLALVSSTVPVLPGDALYPIQGALYRINNDESSSLHAISAVKYSRIGWDTLKQQAKCLPA